MQEAPALTKLNLQYNALRADSKKALETANRTPRAPPPSSSSREQPCHVLSRVA